jgi:hypothetical protein
VAPEQPAPPEGRTKLYFAYGSNLSREQMHERCPASQPIATLALEGYRLAFVGEGTQRWGKGGVATVVPAPDSRVLGALYRITPEDEARLDECEGVCHAQPGHGAYYKDESLLKHGTEPVLVYIATTQLTAQGENPPSQKYYATINRGKCDWGIEALVLPLVL